HVIEHIDDADGILGSLREIADVLIVEVPDLEQDPLNWVRVRNECPFFTDGDHIQEYTLSILRSKFSRNGWNIFEYRRHGGAIAVIARQS
ncbi:MAG: hypothetical protein HKN33_00595, partial [Pyrinomonadaceae bacterium]|nr:hypothetical protein [Pyrinomonadaceae bacterium]